MCHFELGAAGPAAIFIQTLQVCDAQESMSAFTGADTHLRLAMRANQFIYAHDGSPVE
jgi:hypothetical protein